MDAQSGAEAHDAGVEGSLDPESQLFDAVLLAGASAPHWRWFSQYAAQSFCVRASFGLQEQSSFVQLGPSKWQLQQVKVAAGLLPHPGALDANRASETTNHTCAERFATLNRLSIPQTRINQRRLIYTGDPFDRS